MRIAVLLPTRGRPAQAAKAVHSVWETQHRESTHVIQVLDQRDPMRVQYEQPLGTFVCDGNMIQRTNLAAQSIWDYYDVIGWMADDNRFRTPGWDERVVREFADPAIGFVALNDLFWSERDKAVNVFIRSSIPKALGWYANPGQRHHYMDDTWRVLGISTDSYRYLDDVICEHLHPSIGKGDWDDEYLDHESKDLYRVEDRAFIDWIQQHFSKQRAVVKTCLGY